MPRTLALALLVSLAAAFTAVAQGPALTLSRSIRGHVVDAANSAPLRRARLVVSADGRTDTIFTDDEGRFAIAMTSTAPLMVRASKAGYAPAVTAVPPTAAPVELRFTLTRSAAVMGRVVDSYGAPVARAYVTASLVAPDRDGMAVAPRRFFAETDRFGEYRLGTVPTGRYEITAARIPPEYSDPRSSLEDRLFGPREFLDTAERVASLTLVAGAEVGNVDFTILGASQDCPLGSSARAPDGVAPTGIRGRVTSATGEPLACASVVVRAGEVKVPQVYTDRQGRYTIEGLSNGSFVLEARANGYIALQYGQRHPSDAERPIALREGQSVAGVDFSLPRESIVSGTVTDEHGEPLEGVQVWAFEIRHIDGRPTIVSSVISRPTTDDRGQYRLIGLQPGNYVVAALARGAVSEGGRGYTSMYYPGTPDVASAQPVAIDTGRDAQGIDIAYAARPVASVAGTVVGDAGPTFGGTISLSLSGRSGAVSLDSWSVAAANGAFVVRNVPPGDYVLKAVGSDSSPLFGMQYVTVVEGNPPPPVRVAVSAGATIEGRVIVDADRDANLAGLAVSVAPADPDYSPPTPFRPAMFAREDDGTFRATGVRGPNRLVITETPACEGCYLKSAFVNGMDAADTPFNFGLDGRVFRGAEIVVSDAGAAIEGRVHDERDAAVSTFSVVVIPAQRELWYSRSRYLKVARSTAGGAFRAAGLPPGDYLVAAVNRLNPLAIGGQLTDSELLEELSARATRVSLVERERRTLDLRLIRR